ncbi:MAG TPA: SCO5389 family protein [Pseudonocardia sp.]|uniref:SCO5389 family protein n=1 Tax=Pseudonocardia sp. TaxID=60912 RepID=UPI002B4B3E48|nr:SCO5389 family protein [Pseudonocardia sp.]HLU57924.1 SCO5389 family protein [Pseudonocardia sp.]
MSLTVPAALLEKAQQGAVDDEEFVACIRDSLPYAWSMVERLAKELAASGAPSAQNTEVPPDDRAWGEMFRLVASDSMRGAVQRHFGVKLAFQNCCRIGLFRPDATAEYEEFISPRAQLLNQKPELLNC